MRVAAVAVSLTLFLLPPTSFLLPPTSLLATSLLATSFLARAQNDRPLPDPEAFYAAARDNLARAQRATHLYTYRERRTDIHTNPFGKIGTGGTRLFEVYPSANQQLTYRRLVERNGVALAARELADQDRRYREKAADLQKQLARRRPDEQRRREAETAAARRRGQAMIDDVVGALQFSLRRRVTYEGAQAIVVTFTPKPDANPTTREGRIVERFAGTVWVHEAEAEVMRVEAKAIDDLSFGFGFVARLGEGTTATLTRRPVEGGVWMPTELTISGRGRAAVFRRLVVDYVVEWFDYRRMTGESLTPFLDEQRQVRRRPS